jgi:hypothetical protein
MQACIAVLLYLSFVTTSGFGQVPSQAQAQGGEASIGRTPSKTVDLCEALQSAMTLNRSEVAIRGYYRFGTELAGLYGRSCPKKLIVDGKERLQDSI